MKIKFGLNPKFKFHALKTIAKRNKEPRIHTPSIFNSSETPFLKGSRLNKDYNKINQLKGMLKK